MALQKPYSHAFHDFEPIHYDRREVAKKSVHATAMTPRRSALQDDVYNILFTLPREPEAGAAPRRMTMSCPCRC